MPHVQLRIFTEPQQGARYDDLLAVALRAEALGFDAFFRSDHYLVMGGFDGLPGPSDAWITLAGLARDTSTIRLGTLVTSATFRHPGVLAISVANVDDMSGGRVELGLGAGWFDTEHRANGIPFPPVGERFDVLEDHLEIITGMWATADGGRFDHVGRRVHVEGSPGLPKPQQALVPIIIGGNGPRRTPALAARFADEFNLPFRSIDEFVTQRRRVVDACAARDRDPSSMVHGCALTVCVGANEAEVARRASVIRREPDELRANGLCGTPGEVVERLQQWAAVGSERVYLQVLDLADLDHLDLIAAEVMPHV